LPRAYITRLLAEMDDHYEDLLEERSTSMGAARKLQLEQDELQQRLGEPAQLALFAAEQYHARSFWGRHPWVTYLMAPLPMLIACWIGFALAFVALNFAAAYVGALALGWSEETFANLADYVYLQAAVVAFASWYVMVLPPLTAAWILCRTYRRNALNWHWPILGCTLLAAVAGITTTSYAIAIEPGKGFFRVGFDLGTSPAWLLGFLPKFALAFGIGLLLVKRAQRQLELEV
jgi:hypothetical protein